MNLPIAWLPGGWEIVVVLLVIFLLFGTRLPKVARSLGQGISEFKEGLKGVKDDIDRAGSSGSGSSDDSEKPTKS